MAKYTLIAAASLGAAISAFRKDYSKVIETAHVLGVSVLNYTAKAGRTDMLNDFYSGLSVPHQGAFKQYLGRIMGTDKDQHWLSFSQSTFSLVVDRQKQRDAFLKVVPEYLEGTAKGFEPFTTRIALDREADVFADKDFLRALDSLIKRATKDGSHVSKGLSDILIGARNTVEGELNKLDKQANSKATENVIIASKARAKAKGQVESATAH